MTRPGKRERQRHKARASLVRANLAGGKAELSPNLIPGSPNRGKLGGTTSPNTLSSKGKRFRDPIGGLLRSKFVGKDGNYYQGVSARAEKLVKDGFFKVKAVPLTASERLAKGLPLLDTELYDYSRIK